MDDRMRAAVIRSSDRGVKMRSSVEGDGSEWVTVSRDELRSLLEEHAFLCGLALLNFARRPDDDGSRSSNAGTA